MAEAQNGASEAQTCVFITGADTGIGRLLMPALLKRDYRVIGATLNGTAGAYTIRREGVLPVYPDFTHLGETRSALEMARADIVVHLAGLPVNELPHIAQDYEHLTQIIGKGTDNLMQAAGQASVKRVIFPSFAFAYGDQGGAVVDETTELDTSNPLFAAVAQAEMAVLDGGVPGYVLRCGYVYGGTSPRMHQLAAGLKHGQSVAQGGAGIASWLHENDLLQVILTLIERETSADEPVATLYNLADDEPKSAADFIDAFGVALGVDQPARFPRFMMNFRTKPLQRALLNDVNAAVDTGKIREELGWTPQYESQAAGIKQTLLVLNTPIEEVNLEAPPPPDAIAISGKAMDELRAKLEAESEGEDEEEAAEATPKAEAKPEAEKPKAAAQTPEAAGPTPWTDDDEMREKRRQAALERKRKRAAKRAAEGN